MRFRDVRNYPESIDVTGFAQLNEFVIIFNQPRSKEEGKA